MAPPSEFLFDDKFVRELPGDPLQVNTSRQVHRVAYTRVNPTRVSAPRLIAYSREVANELGLHERFHQDADVVAALGGNHLLEGMKPYAACYGGHQFGRWAGQLGDGRAITLGEIRKDGGSRLELQLKGAGPTPYSRGSDGRAVLRSSLREFLCSEAMHHLGVPTTRALSLVLTGDDVVRDMLYNGNAAPEPGAIVARVAPSFLRFGNFELPTSRRDHALLKTLADFAIRTHFEPQAEKLDDGTGDAYTDWVAEVARRTATMVVHWMRVGFVHGVMNTDNMSILGLTIDYGPYGWLEPYDPSWTPNTTDAQGRRYRFGNQPKVAAWNLACLAEAIAPLVSSPSRLADALAEYDHAFEAAYREMMAGKLGLLELDAAGRDGDGELVTELFAMLESSEIDMTLFFRTLSSVRLPDANADLLAGEAERFAEAFYAPSAFTGEPGARMARWLARWSARATKDGRTNEERQASMRTQNPRYVLRNWVAQETIDKATAGDYAPIAALLDVLRRPYDDQPGNEAFAQKRPEWARHKVGCSMLSCSS